MGKLNTLQKHRMDNSGIIYPLVMTKHAQSNYCIGTVFSDKIDIALMKKAIALTFLRYPYFKVRLFLGFFRPYLQENNLPYIVFNEKISPFRLIVDFAKNNHYLIRTNVHENVLQMTFFHGLCDGNGAMEFLKTATYYYLDLCGESVKTDAVKIIGNERFKEETEDSFRKYYQKIPLLKNKKKMASGFAFGVRKQQFEGDTIGRNKVTCDTLSLKEQAKKYSCSIQVFVTALLAKAISISHDSEPHNERYIFFIPVNYRKHFPSESMLNFTGFARCVIPMETRFCMEELVKTIQNELKRELSKEELSVKLSFSSLMSVNPVMIFLPSLVKKWISLLARSIGKKPRQTMIISNLGVLNFPTSDKIERFFFYLNCNKKTPENVGILSYKNNTEICFSRKLISQETEQNFCKLLQEYCPCTLTKEE